MKYAAALRQDLTTRPAQAFGAKRTRESYDNLFHQ